MPMEPASNKQELEKAIRKAAKLSDLSANGLADGAGVSRSHVKKLLRGDRPASLETLMVLAKFLQVPYRIEGP